MKSTKGLMNFLENYKNKISDSEYEKLKWDIDVASEMFRKELLKYAPGFERGRRVQELLDQEIAKESKVQSSCQKGCSACCHFEVEITKDDAEVLKQAVQNGAEFDRVRADEIANRTRENADWKKGMVPSNRCVFLSNDGACRVYQARPSSCRKLSVVGPVIECERPDGQPILRVIPMAEILMNVSINLPDNNIGSLCKMLVQALADDPKPNSDVAL